jgi:hypothetical protein
VENIVEIGAADTDLIGEQGLLPQLSNLLAQPRNHRGLGDICHEQEF